MPAHRKPFNEYRYCEDGSVEIVISDGNVAMIDSSDLHLVNGYRWSICWHPDTDTIYAHANTRSKQPRTTIKMHELIIPPIEGMEVDHRDHNGLNNRRSNLKSVTHGVNMHNQGPRKDNKVGLKGVYAVRDKFRAQIRVNGELMNLGYYETPADAANAYDKHARIVYGENFRSSFPDSNP